jgi:fructose-specific phosphotransferase system IIC component
MSLAFSSFAHILPALTGFLSGLFIGLLVGYLVPCKKHTSPTPTPMSEKLRLIVVISVVTIFLANNIADWVLPDYDVSVALQITLGAILGTTMKIDVASLFQLPASYVKAAKRRSSRK